MCGVFQVQACNHLIAAYVLLTGHLVCKVTFQFGRRVGNLPTLLTIACAIAAALLFLDQIKPIEQLVPVS